MTAKKTGPARPRRPSTRTRTPKAPPVPPPEEEFPLLGTDRKHPALGLGLWALGHWKSEDEASTRATIARAYELGVRWFDTAEVYGAGRSERLLGDVLHHSPGSADAAFVATKVSWEHLRPLQVRAAIINSLERLARSSVDLYLVHAPDPQVPLAETMAALEKLWKERRVGALGVSNFSIEQIEEASRHLSEARITVNQVRYNLFDAAEAEPLVRYCRDHGILVEGYTPLARGILAGRYLDGSRPSPEVRRFAQDLFGESTLPGVLERARQLRAASEEEGVSLASVALRWIYSKGVAPVFGARRPEQVEQVLRAWAERPSDRLLATAEKIARGDRA